MTSTESKNEKVSPQETNRGLPGESSLGETTKTVNSRKIRASLLVAWICAAISLFFLLKGENSAYSFSGGGRISGADGVSAFTYYVIWSGDKRDWVGYGESFGNSLFYNNPYVEAPRTSVTTLPERVARNARIATLFGLAAIFAFWLSRTAKRPRPAPENDLPPVFTQQRAPESADSAAASRSAGSGTGIKRDAG